MAAATQLQSDIGPGQSFEFSFPSRTLTPTGDYIYTITGWQLRDSENRTQSQNVTNTAYTASGSMNNRCRKDDRRC